MPSRWQVPFAGAHADPSLDHAAHVHAGPGARVFAAERWLLQLFLRAMGNPAIRITLWNGETACPSRTEPVDTIRINDRPTLLRFLYDPELVFGEAYTAGRLEVHGDLLRVLRTAYDAEDDSTLGRLLRRARRPRANSLNGSRENIHHHYDLGNDFYRLWLDDRMVYTCAYFPTATTSLEAAQVAKLEHVCRKLSLKPGEHVVEAGCGWGALALHMAREWGVSVRAFNISHEQIAYARECARREGLRDRVEFIEDDYRNISGTCDAFVSVGMLEHVGRDHYRDLGGVIDRCLPAHGRGLIHTLGRNRPIRMNAWLEKYIFPGSYAPTLAEMMQIVEPYNFSVLDVENLRLHYAQTTAAWLERFERSAGRVAAMFDERFVRAWRLYLAGSTAAFLSGAMQLFQMVFARPRHNDLPTTRAHVYR